MTAGSVEHAQALDVIRKLRETLISDLRTLMDRAKQFQERPEKGLGGLNYTLALVSLVACEAAGFYSTGAAEEQKSAAAADVGTYIMQFIQAWFSSESDFKRMDKVLADYLRHSLVHGFGAADEQESFGIALAVDIATAKQAISTRQGGKTILVLNSFALAHHTIKAFERFAKEVEDGCNETLIRKVAFGERFSRMASKGVCNQFECVHRWIEKRDSARQAGRGETAID